MTITLPGALVQIKKLTCSCQQKRSKVPAKNSRMFARRNAVAFEQNTDTNYEEIILSGMTPHPLAFILH